MQLLAGVVASASALTAAITACGGDDDSTGATDTDAGSTSSSGATSSSGSTTSSGGSSGTTSSSGGSSSGGNDAGGDAAKDGGDGGLKANGSGPCNPDGGDCTSGVCLVPNGTVADSYCTIKCDNKNASDPKCQALDKSLFSGTCSKQFYCLKK